MDFGNVDFWDWLRGASGCSQGRGKGASAGVRGTLEPLVKTRGLRQGLWVLLALGATLGPVRAVPAQDHRTERTATVTAAWPSVASFIGVGGLSLIGILALRRRARPYQG